MESAVLRSVSQFAAASSSGEPAMITVVFTGVGLVFAILVLLWLFLLLEGKLFVALDAKKEANQAAEKAQKAAQATAAPAASAPPAVEQGIPPEVVAAISAAVASIEGGRYTLRSVQTASKGRGQWGLAGVITNTEPF